MNMKRLLLTITALCTVTAYLLVTAPAQAAINPMISFQGKLTNTDGTNVADNTYSVRFRIYTDPSADTGACANTCKWEETQGSVSVSGGLFHVNLGSGTALPGSVDFNGNALYLGIKVGGDPEMTPRVRLTAAPYAFNSDTLDGVDSAAFGQLTSTQAWSGTNTFQPTANITGLIVKQTSNGAPSADIFNVQTANSTNVIQVTGPAANEAAVTIASVGATRALTLTSGSGTIVLGASTLQRTASGTLTMNLIDGSNTLLSVTNTGAGTASINVDGGYQVAGTPGASTTCSGGQFLQNQVVNGGLTTGGTCAAGGGGDLDSVYDSDSDKILGVDNTTGLLFDLTTTGNFVVRDGTTAFATFDNTGGILFQPNGSSDITITSDDDSSFIQNGTITNTGQLGDINLTLGADADVDTVSALNIDVTSAATGDADVLYGINIGNLTSADGTALERALRIGSGWDEVFDINGVLLSATELGRLDAKNANLVDENDLISGDGAGAVSSGSGLEAGTGGIGLLQGCADNDVLKWNEASAVWECGSDRATHQNRLSGDYTNATVTFSDVDDNSTGNSDIGFPVGSNETWIFQMNLQFASNTTADSKWQVTAPAGSTCDISVSLPEEAISVSNIACGTTSGNMAIAATTTDQVWISGTITTSATAGNAMLQFGQVAASGTSTIFAGSYVIAYKVSGADLAEIYYTKETGGLPPGTLVSLDPNFEAGVKKPGGPYDSRLLGIISTRPGQVLGEPQKQGQGAPVAVALSGRVPVRVSAENGPIEPGDYLTSSSTSGVAMKATKPGFVVAQALTGYSGSGEGLVAGFIKPIWFSPPLVQGQDLQNSTLDDLTIGKLHVSGDLTVSGDAVFQGKLSVKDIVIEGHLRVGADTTGTAVIPAGQTTANVTFKRQYANNPTVTTSASDYTPVRIEEKSLQGFRIRIPAALSKDLFVDWIAVEPAF
jgi:hypothetical protein